MAVDLFVCFVCYHHKLKVEPIPADASVAAIAHYLLAIPTCVSAQLDAYNCGYGNYCVVIGALQPQAQQLSKPQAKID